MAERLRLVVAVKEKLTSSIVRIVFEVPDGGPLPGYSAGAHITVTTPAGHRRSYSLIEAGEERPRRYAIAVRRALEGRGGSATLHDGVRVGDVVDVDPPRNTFGLEPAGRYLLIAGGIGITPIRAMAAELRRRRDAHCQVVYLTRSPGDTAFMDEFDDSSTVVHHSSTHGRLDLWPFLANPDDGARVYCCGPQALIDEVRALTVHWRPSHVHVEDFAGVDALGGLTAPFAAVWQPTGRRIQVPATSSLLNALRRESIGLPASCESGTCGTCRVRLVSGVADHRDLVLTESERGQFVMPCVSRALSDELVIAPLPGP